MPGVILSGRRGLPRGHIGVKWPLLSRSMTGIPKSGCHPWVPQMQRSRTQRAAWAVSFKASCWEQARLVGARQTCLWTTPCGLCQEFARLSPHGSKELSEKHLLLMPWWFLAMTRSSLFCFFLPSSSRAAIHTDATRPMILCRLIGLCVISTTSDMGSVESI